MSILGTLQRSFRALSATDPKAWNPLLWNLHGSQSQAGEVVTEHTALTSSAVFNAIALISGTIGALPLHLMQHKGERRRVASDLRAYRVLHTQWNPYMTAMAGRECLAAHVLAWGNGYAEIQRDGFGQLVALWPMTPDRVTPEMDGGELVYRVRTEDGEIILPRRQVLHVPGLGFDGFLGYSVISMARKSLGLGMAVETFGSLYFGQGTHPGLVVTHPQTLSDQGHKNLEGSLNSEYSGLGKSHRLMLLDEGMSVEKIGIPPNDSQFLESRKFHISEVARWFNIPPHKLKDTERPTYNSIEQENTNYYVDAILPWLVRFEQNYDAQLLRPTETNLSGRGRLYWKHAVQGLLRADSKSRGEFYRMMFNIGAMNINEIRSLEDLDPVDGGDIHLVPLNMTSLENAGKEPEPPAPPAVPEAPEAPEAPDADDEEDAA